MGHPEVALDKHVWIPLAVIVIVLVSRASNTGLTSLWQAYPGNWGAALLLSGTCQPNSCPLDIPPCYSQLSLNMGIWIIFIFLHTFMFSVCFSIL
jgi:hypothetical protein